MEKKVIELAEYLSSRGITKAAVEDFFEKGYSKGYRRGIVDQKKIMMHVKYKYKLLLNWQHEQLQLFSSYTRRDEYKEIISSLVDASENFLQENGLNSCYKPKKRKIQSHGQEMELYLNDALGGSLHDFVGNFISYEDKRLAEAKQRAEMTKTDVKNSLFPDNENNINE